MELVSQHYIVHSFTFGGNFNAESNPQIPPDTFLSCTVNADPADGSPPVVFDLIGGIAEYNVHIYLNGQREPIETAPKGQLPTLLFFALWTWVPPLKLEAKLDFSTGPGVLKEAWFEGVRPGPKKRALAQMRKNNYQQEYPKE